MELDDGSRDVVHPEVRAHINSLVSALGGVSTDEDGRYQLGDDALEVLRDLKRWIRFYDEKTNRMDVARCIYEANVIEGDLLPILATWPENDMESKFKSRIALACIEVMVPLTWPMEKDKERTTVNHHRHMPVLELAQVGYKRAIINFDGARILHTAVKVALPAMALPIGDRTARDQGVIKLVLFFLRNIAQITPPQHVKYDGDESQISRSAIIDAFSYQDIFHVLLTMASNMGDEFKTEDTTVMEIIYHLVKRADTEQLFMSEQQLSKAKANELSAMMKKEESMLKAYNRKGPTRHNRFGTMIWVKREDGKMSSLSGQDALADASKRNQKMDSSKTYRPPRRAAKEDKDPKDLGPKPKLNTRANDQLREFVQEFLDAGFNPLFQHVRKTIDREAPHVMIYHRRQFFYLVAWFLEAERMRRKSKKGSNPKDKEDINSFNLIAGVLSQEMFITLNKALQESQDYKDWHELTAVMRCFTQILLTVQEMTESGNEEDQEIAENVLSRLFYEESTHDAIATIARTYKDQGYEYLDAATELVHHFLRILEGYSKQNADMQVRSRKRTRRKKKAVKEAMGDDDQGDDEENDGSEDDEASVERTSKERKFDFNRFTSKFTPQGVVDTFVKFTNYYRELSDTQLKRAHRYFYRVSFKQDMSVMLFRVDIIHLLYNMIKGPEPLDKSSSVYKEWEELVKQILRKCTKKIEERPELIVEMLFSKVQATAFFLQYGYERQTMSTASKARPAAELVFKSTEELDRQIAIVVGALLDKNHADHIAWVKKVLTEAESERRAWAAAEEARQSVDTPAEGEEGEQSAEREAKPPPAFDVQPDDDERRSAMFKNSHLRLLMRLAHIDLLYSAANETIQSAWQIPPDVTADQIKDILHYINQAKFSPPTFDEGVLAEHQLKRKAAPAIKKAVFDDDEEGESDDGLFPLGGPTARKPIDEVDRPKKTRKRRREVIDGDDDELDDSIRDEKARRRREREREKAAKIKSALYVKEGDDEFDSEEDEAFFAREREIASRAAKAAVGISEPVFTARKKSKPAAKVISDDSDDEDENELDDLNFARRVMSSPDAEDESDKSDDEDEDSERKRQRVSKEKEVGLMDGLEDVREDGDVEMGGVEKGKQAAIDEDEDEDADAPVVKRRPRVRGGFVVDSDDDE